MVRFQGTREGYEKYGNTSEGMIKGKGEGKIHGVSPAKSSRYPLGGPHSWSGLGGEEETACTCR
jgi:hypothetical protein